MMLRINNFGLFFGGGFALFLIASVSGVFAFAAHQTRPIIGTWIESKTRTEMIFNERGIGLWKKMPYQLETKRMAWEIPGDDDKLFCEVDSLMVIFRIEMYTDTSVNFRVITGQRRNQNGKLTFFGHAGKDSIIYHMIRVKPRQ